MTRTNSSGRAVNGILGGDVLVVIVVVLWDSCICDLWDPAELQECRGLESATRKRGYEVTVVAGGGVGDTTTA